MFTRLTVRTVPVSIRAPWAVWVLTFGSLGVYAAWYWYVINREMREYSAAVGAPLGNDPLVSLIAAYPGMLLVVPPFVTDARTAIRIRRCLDMAGVPGPRPSTVLTLVLGLVLGLHLPYLQWHLNRVWHHTGAGAVDGVGLAHASTA